MWAYPADKIYFQSCSGGLNFFLWRELTQHENTFQYLFVLKEKQDVKSFQFMCGFSKYQKSPILSLWAFDEYITALNHSVNSCSSVGLRLVYTLAWPADPGQGFTVCETTVLHQGWWPFYPLELHKQVRDWNAFLWRRERREKKCLSFIIQMKWSPADGGRRAAGLRQRTSRSLPLIWVSPQPNKKKKKFKGISNHDGSH